MKPFEARAEPDNGTRMILMPMRAELDASDEELWG